MPVDCEHTVFDCKPLQLRSDGVSPNILGMRKIVSEDALRRALGKIPEAEGTEWMRKHLLKSVVS